MARASRKSIVKALLDAHGRTFAEELKVNVARNTPAVLFQLLYMALLLSARVPAGNAMQAARALIEAGLTTPKKMARASWQERVDVITWHGYKRYDERTSTMLGDTYGGDLRRLREEAEHDVAREKVLLQQFSGIGDSGSDIFLREIQLVWNEAYPYADARVLKAARQLGLGGDVRELARLTRRRDFSRLAAALVRVDLGKAYEEVLKAA